MPRLLLTRARAQAEAFATEVRAATSLAPIIAPMQEMRDLGVEIDLTGIQSFAFTSKNGVAACARMTPVRLPAYCVGPATADLARALGFEAIVAEGNAASLKRILPQKGVLHLHGRHVTQALGVQNLAIYDQVALPLSPEARRLLAAGCMDAVAVFSPRAGRLLMQERLDNNTKNITYYALSEAVAAGLPHDQNIRICSAPTAPSMLRLLSADFPR